MNFSCVLITDLDRVAFAGTLERFASEIASALSEGEPLIADHELGNDVCIPVRGETHNLGIFAKRELPMSGQRRPLAGQGQHLDGQVLNQMATLPAFRI
jgi:hypothetical protein